jgi:dUTP pyrophosphatase
MQVRYYVTELGSQMQIAPRRAKSGDAGFDLQAALPDSISIAPNQKILVPTGVGFVIAPGWFGSVRDRSGMAVRGLITAGGVIDQGYTGEVKIVLWNVSDHEQTIAPLDRIAQIIFQPYYTNDLEAIDAADVPTTERGASGFGSTGLR